MAIKCFNKINVGRIVNDGLGDDIRTAFLKINGTFDHIEELMDIALSRDAENVGGGVGLFKQKNDNILEFRSISGGRYTDVEEVGDTVVINNTTPQPFTRIDTNIGSVFSARTPNITIGGGDDIIVTADDSTGNITIDTRTIDHHSFMSILSTYDFGPIDGDFNNPVQFDLANTNIEFGTITVPSHTNLDCGFAFES